MSTKHALIVDDSRSARLILGRMLESFGLKVDAVESAELAITYLQTARPDVIFMDHLMPGMDGFAAVRVIKANPDTATIPVLMYTSQEGDMYLSQARALGAMGVLPKTLKHADVAEALEHLNLHAPITPAAARPPPLPRTAPSPPAPVAVERERHEVSPVPAAAAQHEAPSALTMPQLAHRIATEVHAQMQRTPVAPETGARWRLWALFASCSAVLLLAVVIYQQLQIQQQLTQLQSVRLPTTSSTPALRAAAPTTMPVNPLSPVVTTATLATAEVPYGEVPLAGARLEQLRSVIEGLRAEQMHGVLRVAVFFGDFCLTGNAVTGYTPAADDLLASRCDVIGNPFGDALSVQQRQSVAFANLVASVNSNASGGLKVQLADGGRKPLVAYPTPAVTLTAASWNRIAERNQRVEYSLLPLL